SAPVMAVSYPRAGADTCACAWTGPRSTRPSSTVSMLMRELPHEHARRTWSRHAMSVELCGLKLEHPIVNGSGTFDAIAARRAFGQALEKECPFAAFVSKTITLRPREGNPPPRLWESPAGLINSIGLPNKGLEAYVAEDLPQLRGLRTRLPRAASGQGSAEGAAGTWPVPLFTNVMGSTAEEFSRLLEGCEPHAEIAALELNVSCPNVSTGLDIGSDPRELERVVAHLRGRSHKPLIVKLTPN